jgi:hypothetical protein
MISLLRSLGARNPQLAAAMLLNLLFRGYP